MRRIYTWGIQDAQRLFFIGLVVLLAGLLSPRSFGHPGGLDANGGHYNRKTGEYHFHESTPRRFGYQSRGSTISLAERDRRLNEYFRVANAGVIYYEGGKTKRDVSGSQRERVLERDDYQCVICGSTIALEVDHKRALMNGGDNSLGNLATLCKACHTVKTKMDNSLRRKRGG